MSREEALGVSKILAAVRDWYDLAYHVFLGAVVGHTKRYTRTIVMFVGKEGSGKTYSAISLAKELDPHFSPDRIVFDVDNLLEKTIELKNQCAWIIFDETGEYASNRSFMSGTNRVLNSVIRTNRKWGVNYILTSPLLMDMDARLRKSINFVVEIKPHKSGANSRIGLCFEQLYNPASTKPEFNRHVAKKSPDNSLMFARFPNPADRWSDLLEEYEEKKDSFLIYIHSEASDERTNRRNRFQIRCNRPNYP
ncbi:MAG: hypothetical protein ACE5OZ_25220 [Candidatus Heimdallarchaeota archaeon]